MIYRIHQIKLNIDEDTSHLKAKSAQILGVSINDIINFEINKRSIDARKKDQLCYVYAIDVTVNNKLKKKFKENEVSIVTKNEFIVDKIANLDKEVTIIGLGPAGLLAGYVLALAGIKPIIYERGKCCTERQADIDNFHKIGILNPESNVCFGEGGAGTFSDGKLNTLIKDKEGYGRFVLKTFCEFGAKEDIMYDNKPHIGTDKLVEVVTGLRKKIEELGGEVHFEAKLEDIIINNNQLDKIIVNNKEIDCKKMILATGHSARDTFYMLKDRELELEAKAYAIGVRVLHDQNLINKSQYGDYADKLPAAAYKITHQCSNGRGVYSFCMCPGGYVVNASSENEQLVINGMSYSGRDGNTANSAIVVTVNPNDYKEAGFGEDSLSGIKFQRYYENLAYKEANGKIVTQKLVDFNNNRVSSGIPDNLAIKGQYLAGNINNCLPDYVCKSISEGMSAFDKKIHGFGDSETVLLGIETRTSSPVRVNRNEAYMSNIEGIYPCGEGAGYAGGIMSAAIDGIKVARAIIEELKDGRF